LTQDTQKQAEIEKGDRRRFRAWPFIRAFWPCIVSMALLVVVAYMRRLDSLGDHGELPAWVWWQWRDIMAAAWLVCVLGCLAAYRFTDEHDRGWTVLANVPPLILLYPHLVLAF